ncbi:MAG TPA: redoxin domain-containing protein [Saprospiraceae bacterium]|nr:redoxin domain-containing protein [Saprospiraceae bacterium]
MIKKGDQAPLFTLKNTEKMDISLKDYKGKNVVLLFFPLAFSSVCTWELCQVRDDHSSYNQWEADIIAISVDSLYTLRKFKDEQGIPFSFLSDWNKEVSRAYGTLYEDFGLGMKGVAKRSAFIIDKKGIIQYAEVLENAGEIPNFESIKKMLSDLKA